VWNVAVKSNSRNFADQDQVAVDDKYLQLSGRRTLYELVVSGSNVKSGYGACYNWLGENSVPKRELAQVA